MRKAGGTATLVGLALALAGLLNGLALPVYARGQMTRTKRTLRPQRSRQHSEGAAKSVNPASLPRDSKEQPLQPNVITVATAKIAFSSDRDGNYEIYTMEASGGGLSRLTENNAEDTNPTWSPDGNKIAFVSTRDGNSEIYVMSADGTSQTRLTNNTADDLSPSWSPDGTRIAFSSRRDGNDEIYIMNPDGTGQLNLTNNAGDDTNPSFSPDSTRIAFASNRTNSQYDIYRLNSDGSNVVQLTSNSASDSNPNWSQDKITFQTDRDGDEEIYSMNANDGSSQTNISNNAAFDVEPSRTADGNRVVFASTRSGNDFELFLMNSDGSSVTRLTNNPGNDIQPAFQLGAIPPPPSGTNTVQFSSTNYTVNEDGVFATITVTRTGTTTGAATVEYATSNGSATDRGDYTPAVGTLRFAAGETSKTFIVSIIDDAFIEADESLNLTLRNPTGTALGSPSTATLTIVDNDSTILSTNRNPIDNAPYFIRQLYRDFLNREPEPEGLQGWVNILNNCAFGDVRCDRIEIASAFYRSSEFQGRGYFIYRFYSTAFGRFPHYAEFVPDLARVSGFQTPAELEASKAAFIADFMSRPEFRNRYDALDSAGYVNALVATAGVTLPNKDQLIADLAAGRKTRAQVLREIVESVQVYNKFYNEAFVVMAYIGFLHRDPDILFLNWLGMLNQTGDYRTLVAGFVNSLEYRGRFGPP
jgi:Tol biopolymer transport system component